MRVTNDGCVRNVKGSSRPGSLYGFTRFDAEQRALILARDDIQQPVRTLTNIANSLM
jgi:hypothetical protein